MSETFIDWNTDEGLVLMERTRCWTATGEQLQVVMTTIEPGREFPAHSHPHEQFCVVLSGTFEFDVDGSGSRALGPRGVFYFEPNQAHGGRVIGDEPVTLLEAFHPVRHDYTAESTIDHDVPQ